MPFREIDRPDAANIIELPQENVAALIPVPPPSLFRAELAFWRTTKNEADRAGDEGAWRVADEATRGIREALAGRFAIEQMIAANVYEPVLGGGWFVQSVLTMSHSRFMREVHELPTRPPLGISFTAKNVAAVIDYNEADPYRSGLHVTPEYMRNQLAMQPPKLAQARHFEGEQIYMTATAPADPTDVMFEDFESAYGVPFNPKGFVSIVPCLKRSYWEHGLEA